MALSEITGFCFAADARFGSNGVVPGTPECVVGKSPTSQVTGRLTWDDNVQDGVGSGWIGVELIGRSGGGDGGVSWAVKGGTVYLTYSGVQYGYITKVTLRAGVNGAGRRVSFRNVKVKFYANNSQSNPAESLEFDDADAPVASTMEMQDPVDNEAILDVEPDGSTHRKIVVSADVRLEAEGPGYPAPTDLFAQVFVFTSSCN